ncbi:MAG: DUF2953 domain-containing protein [Clostridia bacterium]|nr:DUF2953 domain-containing protein [Clostridia bacterium]
MFYFFLFLMIVLVVLICSDVVVFTEYAENEFSLCVKFLKITVYDSKGKKPKKQPEKQKKSEKKQKFSFEILKKYLNIISGILPEVKKAVKYFKRKIKARKFSFEMVYGLSDAAECGIANGIIWAVWGQVFAVLNEFIDFKNPRVSITPLFNNMDSLNVKYSGIYKLKIYHIIIIGIYFVKIYNKYKKLKGGVLNG